MKDPYSIIIQRYQSEKTVVLQNLKESSSNPSLRRFTLAKYVFIVHMRANKAEIKSAIEAIYANKKVKVASVNTLYAQGKAKRRRGIKGFKSGFKKAIVTFAEGEPLDENV